MTNTPRFIEKNEIRKGDKIRVHFTKDDAEGSYTGVVDSTDSDGDVLTRQRFLLTYTSNNTTERYELLERASKPLPKGPGTVIRAKKVRGVEGDWTLFRTEDDGTKNDWVSNMKVTTINGCFTFHSDGQIEDWEVLQTVKVGW